MKLFGFGRHNDFGELFNLGLAQYRAGQLNNAVNYFNQAIDVRSDVPDVFYQRGLALARMGDISAAIRDFEEVYSMWGAEKYKRDVCYNLGKAYDELQRFPESIFWYNRAAQIDPAFANVYANRGGVHLKLADSKSDAHEFSLALEDLNTALRLNPSDALAFYNRATANTAMNQNPELVINDLQRFLELAPANHPYRPQVEKLLANSARPASPKLDMMRERKQKELLDRIIKANDEQHYDEAIGLCEKYLEESRSEAAVWDEKAFAVWNLGRQQEALAICLEGLSVNPDGARLYNTAGLLYVELKQYHEALGAFEKYLVKSPPEYASQFPRVKKRIEELKRLLNQ